MSAARACGSDTDACIRALVHRASDEGFFREMSESRSPARHRGGGHDRLHGLLHLTTQAVTHLSISLSQ